MIEDKYTWDDIIIDPTSDRAKEAVGKECYFDDIPIDCLRNANCDYINSYEKLIDINNEFKYPFAIGMSYHLCIIVKKEEPYEERAKKWIEENNLKAGDYVKVTRKAVDYEDGWSIVWVSKMTESVGKIMKVEDLNANYSITLEDSYHYPYFVLEKVEPPKPKYVPFESKEEFIEALHYHDNAKYSETEDILLNYGMWLRLNELYVLVTCISDEYIEVFNFCYYWDELPENFTFLDDTPCGKLTEESND